MPDAPPLGGRGPYRDHSEVVRLALEANARRPRKATPQFVEDEKARCVADPAYFIDTYCQIYDNATAAWIPFKLWPAQREALALVLASKYTIVLKARQEGLTWLLGDAYPLYLMLFRPIQEVLVFSQRDDEAKDLLERMKGTYSRLPDWLRQGIIVDNDHEFRLVNGSGAQALPATAGGRSHAATYVVVDEADFIENVAKLVTAAKPTIDAGLNKLVMLSTVNIDTPDSYFQKQYVSARDNPQGLWRGIFLSWRSHPGRTQDWYNEQCAEALRVFDSLDTVYKEYPETDEQALSARSRNAYYSAVFVNALTELRPALVSDSQMPSYTALKIYVRPVPGRRYGIGVDPAGGQETGDDSAACVLDAETLDQVGVLYGKFDPTRFADMVQTLSNYYYGAPILYELNNHGYALRARLKELGANVTSGIVRDGSTGKPGWYTTEPNKAMLFDTGTKAMAEALRGAWVDGRLDPALAVPILHDEKTRRQLLALDATEMAAPESVHDDLALAWLLAVQGVFRGSVSLVRAAHELYAQKVDQRIPGRPGQSARGWAPPFADEQAVWQKLKDRGLL